MRKVTIAPISSSAFAPFGDLLDQPCPSPRQDHAARITNTRPAATANLALVRSEPFATLLPLTRLECHPDSSQLFLPLSVTGYLVVVAPDRGGRPDETGIRAFAVPGTVGINYHPGTWHAHMMTWNEPGTFAMLVHEDGTARDCLFAPIGETMLDDPPA